MKTSLIHPPSYVNIQIRPAIQKNDLTAEVVWTYLMARKYEKDHRALANILCGQDKMLPENSKIWLEAYLQPTRQDEHDSWKTRADLAMGHLEKIKGTKNQIQSNGGDWVCIVESKWYDDIHTSAVDDGCNQLLKIINHALLLHDGRGSFPKSVYVTLVTPRYFKGLGKPSHRQYSITYNEYTKEPEKLKKDLMRCYQLPFLKHDVETLIGRIGALKLNWVTFEELLRLPNLVEDHKPGKYIVTLDSWKDIFLKMDMEDLYKDLSSTGSAT